MVLLMTRPLVLDITAEDEDDIFDLLRASGGMNADEVAGQMRGGIFRRGGRRIAQAVAAKIVSDDAEMLSKRARLVKPHSLAAAEAVQQHHRRAVAVSDTDVIDSD